MYETTTTLYRDEFATRGEYLAVYRDFCRHYGYRSRVEGGWMFFKSGNDYRTWRNQR